MKITVHAGQRFLESVLNKERSCYMDVDFAIKSEISTYPSLP